MKWKVSTEISIKASRPQRAPVAEMRQIEPSPQIVRFSPNGLIAFARSPLDGETREIFTMRADGTDQKPLNLPVEGKPGHPAWSPDGKRIAFALAKPKDHFNLWIQDLNGSPPTQLTSFNPGDGPVWRPAWSPDGTLIAFEQGKSQTSREIFVVRADGTDMMQITDGLKDSNHPTWSPDGTRIAFARERNKAAGEPYEVMIINADKTELGSLTLGSDPSWSPDGKTIVYAMWSKPILGNPFPLNIHSIGFGTSDPSQLTDNPEDELEPAWSPDGKKIVFVRHLQVDSTNREIYTMDADGSQKQRLTVSDTTRSWSPDWQRRPAPQAAPKVTVRHEVTAPATNDFNPQPDPDWTVTTNIEIETEG